MYLNCKRSVSWGVDERKYSGYYSPSPLDVVRINHLIQIANMHSCSLHTASVIPFSQWGSWKNVQIDVSHGIILTKGHSDKEKLNGKHSIYIIAVAFNEPDLFFLQQPLHHFVFEHFMHDSL